ncbi:heat shock protein HspQ [Acuticoccus yangtzensis]|uniref:heat shock protein HspQ n=1 Tax=Acuticoccus yangtzensis TaxID=1443441 RepID=UPI0009498C16|nr:heat shock protein HspQ [Acuticoccus yangtzensis]ORE94254.1 hemimethylated DNA binding protein [Stappia sp. 22II-S9-Z10]
MIIVKEAKFNIGQLVRHRHYDFVGMVVDVDPVFADTEEWYQAIPKDRRPHRDQPFYRLRVDDNGVESVAYVSEQNLLSEDAGDAPQDGPGSAALTKGDLLYGLVH